MYSYSLGDAAKLPLSFSRGCESLPERMDEEVSAENPVTSVREGRH
jgi:hypothetical protein